MALRYEDVNRVVSPVTDLLKAVVEVNAAMAAAEHLGWDVKLTIGDAGWLLPLVSRSDSAKWPTAGDEA